MTLSFLFLEDKTDSEKGEGEEKEEVEEEEEKQAASKPRLKQAGYAVQNGSFVTNYSSLTEYCLRSCGMLGE